MGVFYHEEEQPNHSKRCKCFATALKEVFTHCQTFGRSRRLSTTSLEEEFPISDLDEEQEVIVSVVRSRAMEKQKNKPGLLRESFSWVYSPTTRELCVTGKMEPKAKEGGNEEQGEKEEFLSVKSCFSMYSSSANGEGFYSVKTNLSRCSSLNEFDLSEYWKRSIIQEFCHCEGWPFGLCRKAVLLPPLPKSPSESWLYRKILSSTKVT
ncbi:hypothetical protein MtrunA17_Chr1g0153711 [Medicago truncatula]|uniref:Uncharacterized protein n=2 Tax=Medicago truncatula TaxID=3880 RepID=G7I4F7_MEDTR|nr:uncharacterized protein LOC11422467 [Medicago truncatula]AES59474.1 hypothetical protein MTR_1g019800 [Medicago truncatula]RHN77336.1 hypothetical protein MtrunA17_Chr1g0153711 [Medicago truncatula]